MRHERTSVPRAAVDADLDSPSRQLPPSIVSPTLQARRDEVAACALGRIGGAFVPTPEEVVPVSKAGHGMRPVAVWDLPSRLAYRALADRLRPGLPPVDRGKAAYRVFLRAPLAGGPRYVVASDIIACYEQIDHALLSAELVAQTGDHAAVDAIAWLLRSAGGRAYGLPQQSPASDLLADAFLRRLERALVRRGLKVSRIWRMTSPASIVLPSPTSSASKYRTTGSASARATVSIWTW